MDFERYAARSHQQVRVRRKDKKDLRNSMTTTPAPSFRCKWTIAFDAPRDRVEQLIRRELQTCGIHSIRFCSNLVEVEVECPSFSQVIAETEIGGVPFIETLHHSAVLPRWLHFLRGEGDLTVLHVDSHSDLGIPNLVMDLSGAVADRWTRERVLASEPATVRCAVDTSAIEIGNYLTAAVLLLPIRGVAWVHPPMEGNSSRCDRTPLGLRLDWLNSDSLDSSLRRLHAIRGGPPKDLWFFDTSEPVSDGLTRLDDSKAILDIDLDYFDNSGHSGHERFSSATFDQRLNSFRDLIRNLDPGRVAAISIARSPGFCPAAVASRLSATLVEALTQWQKRKS
jgi:hypothetical protein